jgi:hypothetical protein
MIKIVYAVLVSITMVACNASLKDSQKIIDKSIEVSGGENYLNSTIEFDFRGRHYVAQREGGKYSYERITRDSTNTVHDFLTNNGFKREINNTLAEVADSMKIKYTSSVNSVVYFALLPYGLNDSAVQKKLLGETSIENAEYYMIEITFAQEGGGEDHEDVFIYWINKKDFTIGYMAYSYEESDGIGLRFRKAYNPRTINGILFLDYINLKPNTKVKITELEELFKKGELKELSKIELTNIQVK